MDKERFSKLFIMNIALKLKHASQVWSLNLMKYKEIIEKIKRKATKETITFTYHGEENKEDLIVIFKFLNQLGDVIYHFFFSKRYSNGQTICCNKKLFRVRELMNGKTYTMIL